MYNAPTVACSKRVNSDGEDAHICSMLSVAIALSHTHTHEIHFKFKISSVRSGIFDTKHVDRKYYISAVWKMVETSM